MSELQEFVEHIQAWHENHARQLRTIVDAPKETEVRLGEGEGQIILTADQARWFRAGVIVALEHLGKLPFSVEPEDDE
jgi:hypothetical protein